MPLTERLTRRLAQLLVGLIAYGVSITLMLKANLGNQPWDVFHQGAALRAGISVGNALIITGAAVLLCWIPLRQRPGIGTVANILVIGVVVDLTIGLLPQPGHLAMRWLFMTSGILICGLASGLYLGADLGPGPRDGLMTGLATRGWSLRGWRTTIEITVVAIGALLGGKVGIGTIAYALAIGPLAQFFLPMFTVRPRHVINSSPVTDALAANATRDLKLRNEVPQVGCTDPETSPASA